MPHPELRRVAVVGSSCAGKTTFARALAARLAAPHVELDALHWGPGWQAAETDAFRADVARALAGPRWVVDGNYAVVRDLVWPPATHLVWLDYGFPRVFGRALLRTCRRIVTRETLYGGNQETLRGALARDGIPLWVIRTFRRRRRQYPRLLERPEHAHLVLLRFRHPREAERFLAGADS